MKRIRLSLLGILLLTSLLSAQVVPRLVNYSGRVVAAPGKAPGEIMGMTFSIYRAQDGGAPLWMETQNVTVDARGSYSVQLGATTSEGLPLDLFSTGEARWLGVQVSGQAEQPRALLLSVPYALKAADAETLGGLPLSAFVLAAPGNANLASGSSAISTGPAAPTPNNAVTGTGTVNAIPLWDTTSDIVSSVLTQTGSGISARIGINTTTPAATLDVKGAATVRGAITSPPVSSATATAGKTSQPQNLIASSFNSGSKVPVNQTFQWKAEPTGNNTAAPSGTLNLLFGSGTAAPAETGLAIASTGQMTFAAGQTFPGTGPGTITGVTAGSGLSGGGTAGLVNLSIPSKGISNAMLAAPSLTVTAGTDLTGGGAVTLGGSTTLNLDTTKVPQLNAANAFTGNQTINGNLSATGVVTGSGYQIGSNLFGFGSHVDLVSFLGFAGSAASTGQFNTGVGAFALGSNTTGTSNTAVGADALFFNLVGTDNTAVGFESLAYNTGSGLTAVGSQALEQNSTGVQSTAVGDGALEENTTGCCNSAVGFEALANNTTGGGNTAIGQETLTFNTEGSANTAVGQGSLIANTTGGNNTGTGENALGANTNGNENSAMGNKAVQSNTTGSFNVGVGALALSFNTTGSANTCVGEWCLQSNTTGNDNTCIGENCDVSPNNLHDATAIGARAMVSVSDALVLGSVTGVNGATATTRVGIGTSSPTAILTIGRGAGHPVSDSWETYSSRRWKTNIQTLPDALARVELLRGVSYDLKDSGKHEIGVIAEEVGAVVPELVTYEANGKDARGVDYSRLTALLIEAVKQQQAEIEKQEAKLAKQEVKLARAVRTIEAQQTTLREQRASIQALQGKAAAKYAQDQRVPLASPADTASTKKAAR